MKRIIKESIDTVDRLYDFFDYDGQTYYEIGDDWTEQRPLSSFFERVKDFDGKCKLWSVSADYMRYFYLTEDYITENAVLEDFYDMLYNKQMDQQDGEVDEEDIIIDGIIEIPLDVPFLSIDYVQLEKDEVQLLNARSNASLEFSEYMIKEIDEILPEYIPERMQHYTLEQFVMNPFAFVAYGRHTIGKFMPTSRDGQGGYVEIDMNDDVFLYRLREEKDQYFSSNLVKLINNWFKENV